MIDLDSESLVDFCEDFVAREIRKCRLDGGIQFACRLDFAFFSSRDDKLSDSSGIIDLSVDFQNPFQVLLPVAVDDVCRCGFGFCVHPHVQRGVETE